MQRSYNGWTASQNPKDFGGLVELRVGTETFPPGVRAGSVHKLLSYVATQLDKRVEPVAFPGGHPADDWGYNYRPNKNNPSTLSCHASGTAFDYNATRHPNGRSGTWSAKQTAEIKKILAEVGNSVRCLWGYDEMHFEVVASPATVDMIVGRLGSPVTTLPVPKPEEFLMALSDTQQRDLYNAIDFLKKRTEARDVQRFQRVNEAGQVVVCGPNDPGAEPTRSSDALDAVYAARQIEDLRAQVVRLEATVASLRK